MKADEVLKLLEKHEAQCDKRYSEIQDKLKSLDSRVWGLYGVIIGVALLEKVFSPSAKYASRKFSCFSVNSCDFLRCGVNI